MGQIVFMLTGLQVAEMFIELIAQSFHGNCFFFLFRLLRFRSLFYWIICLLLRPSTREKNFYLRFLRGRGLKM